MPARLALVRHGQSTWNSIGRWQGQADPPLSALGEEQAAEAAGRLVGAGIDVVVASDLARARRTAEVVAKALGLAPPALWAELREYDVGQWSGLTKPEIEERWPGMQEEWFQGRLETTPGGEGRAHFERRVREAVGRIAREAGPHGTVLVVTHGGVIRAVERGLGAEPVPIANLSGRWFELDGDGLVAGAPLVLVGPDHQTVSPSA